MGANEQFNLTEPPKFREFGEKSGSGCDQTDASKHCLKDVFDAWSKPGQAQTSGKVAGNDIASNNAPLELVADAAERPDIASGLFDPKKPLSHFDTVAPGVYRSGRPLGAEGVEQEVERAWNDQTFNSDHAKETTIIELRGYDKPPYYQPNEDEVHAEEQNAAALGITHIRFPLQTHEVLAPESTQKILDYIDEQKAAGQKVVMHCYHGTDRTGTIAAAYQLSHEPELQELVRNDPDEAIRRALESMKENGFVKEKMPELTQSVEDYVAWKHERATQH